MKCLELATVPLVSGPRHDNFNEAFDEDDVEQFPPTELEGLPPDELRMLAAICDQDPTFNAESARLLLELLEDLKSRGSHADGYLADCQEIAESVADHQAGWSNPKSLKRDDLADVICLVLVQRCRTLFKRARAQKRHAPKHLKLGVLRADRVVAGEVVAERYAGPGTRRLVAAGAAVGVVAVSTLLFLPGLTAADAQAEHVAGSPVAPPTAEPESPHRRGASLEAEVLGDWWVRVGNSEPGDVITCEGDGPALVSVGATLVSVDGPKAWTTAGGGLVRIRAQDDATAGYRVLVRPGDGDR